MIRSILRIALVACLAVLLPVSPSLHAQSAPALAKKLAKLEKQFVKQQATLDKAQDTLAALAAQALVADDQLAAVAAMPVGTPAEQKAAAKALKKAQKLVGKLANSQLKGTAKEAKAQQKLDGLADQIELLDPGHFDDTTTGDGGDGGDGEDGSGDGGDDPGTGDPGSGDDGTGDPGTGDPGTGDPGTGDPGTGDPGSGDPGSGDPGSGDPGSGDPGSGDPGSGDPGSGDPGSGDPGSGDPGSGDPGSGDPGSGDPGSGDPGSGDPGSGDPGSGDPGGGDPTGSGVLPEDALPLLAVDCGDLNGYAATEPGYALLTETSAPAGVALSPAAIDTVHVAHFFEVAGYVAFPSSVIALDPDQVGERRKLTALQLASPTTLTLSGLPPDSQVSVLLELGATAPWVEFNGTAWTGIDSSARGLKVERDGPAPGAQWTTVARDLRCSTGTGSTSFAGNSGSILPLRVLATTDAAGKLALRLSTETTSPVFLSAFRVWRREPLPIAYRRGAGGPLRSTAPAAAAFVAAFNAADGAAELDGAELAARAIGDPLLRGVALLHVAGWLDGSRDGRLALLPEARAALAAACAQGHAVAAELLEQLDHVQRAVDHLAARGYSHSFLCEGDGGEGFLNPACAGQIFQYNAADCNVNFQIAMRELRGLIAGSAGASALADLAAWNAGALSDATYEPSPLVFTALKLYATAIAAMDPLLTVKDTDPESVAMVAAARAIFDDFTAFGFAATEFPHDHELKLFRAEFDSGTHPKDWNTSAWNLFSGAELADAWWGAATAALPDDPAAPAWADAQRNLQRTLGAFVTEWLDTRFSHGELGGGLGDDIELMLQLYPLSCARRDGADRLHASRMDDLVHYALESSGAVADGYWAGNIADVEHTGEYTSDPLLASRGMFGDTARTALIGGLNGRHVLGAGGNSFAAVNAAGRTRFKSYYMTTLGPSAIDSVALDVFLNGRAVGPALALAGRGALGASHPLVADLRAWAAGWRDDALLSPGAASGKPVGFPAPAQWSSGAVGTGGLWFTEKALATDAGQWTSGEVGYVLGLLSNAYRQSVASDRWTFLLPAVRMFRSVAAWEDAGQPPGAAGSGNWAAAQLRNGGRFGIFVLDNLPDFAADPSLTTLVDPLSGSSTYVDAALLARMRAWIENSSTDQGPVLRYALPDVGNCGGHQGKNPLSVGTLYTNALAYFRTAWPLLCRHAMHTDRVFANVLGVQRELVTAWTGAATVEGLPYRPLLRWSGQDLDLAVLVNHRDAAGTTVSAFVHNFAPVTAAVTLTLGDGLVPGSYLLETGAASPSCDVFPGSVTSTMLTKRGLGVRTSLALPPGLNLVRLTRTGAAPAATRFDLVLDPPRLLPAGGGAYTVAVRVANAGLVAAPASTLALHVAAVDADGAPIAPAALPSEQLYSTATINLGGATGFVLPQQTVTFALPAGSPLVTLLQSGQGLQLRAEILTTDDEWDSANDEQLRCWSLADLADG